MPSLVCGGSVTVSTALRATARKLLTVIVDNTEVPGNARRKLVMVTTSGGLLSFEPRTRPTNESLATLPASSVTVTAFSSTMPGADVGSRTVRSKMTADAPDAIVGNLQVKI